MNLDPVSLSSGSSDFDEMLKKAGRSLRIADHMVYITYPLIKESNLLKKVLEQLSDVAGIIIKTILNYEYLYKRIQLSKDEKLNWEAFKQKCAPRFDITLSEIEKLNDLFVLAEKHKGSSFEFIRKNKLVIMSNNLRTESIGLDKLKQNLIFLKTILQKTKEKIENKT